MKESALPNIKAYLVRKDKLYYDEILETIGKIFQSGLNIYWRNHNYGLEKTAPVQTESVENDDGYQPITIDHLQPAFIFLAIGFILSALVFCCEFMVDYNRSCRKRNN